MQYVHNVHFINEETKTQRGYVINKSPKQKIEGGKKSKLHGLSTG